MIAPEPIVYVIDDDEPVRESLTWLISSVDLNVKSYSSATAFLEDCDKVQTGCLITDIRMPGLSGLDLQNELVRRGIDIPIIVISGHGDVQTAVRAMKAGAFDFIEKPFNDQLLLDLVHKAVTHSLSSSETTTQQTDLLARHESLTPRERQVLDLIANGEPNKSIGRALEISDKTVEAHRAKVMSKMQAGSLAELVKMVLSLERG
ncbi:MAG: response regulator transcription factor [Rhodospirillales bacterium]|nr:response regulator transcription factor [Rhodospirillales bacterium]